MQIHFHTFISGILPDSFAIKTWISSEKYLGCSHMYVIHKTDDSSDGTQISRIIDPQVSTSNSSGFRGVYFEKRSNKWRARLKFKGKIMSFGSYTVLKMLSPQEYKPKERISVSFLKNMASHLRNKDRKTIGQDRSFNDRRPAFFLS